MNSTHTLRRSLGRILLALCALPVLGLTSCASIQDDVDVEILAHNMDRARAVIDASASGGASSIQSALGIGSTGGQAGLVESHLSSAMVKSGAFDVLDRTAMGANINPEGVEEGDPNSKARRADLLVKCTLTRLNPDAEVEHSNWGARAWYWVARRFSRGWYGWFGGGVQNSTRKAECDVSIKVVDVKTNSTLAQAEATAWSVGTASEVSGRGSILGGGGNIGTGSKKDANLSLAVERAVIRALNELVPQIPKRYFKHKL